MGTIKAINVMKKALWFLFLTAVLITAVASISQAGSDAPEKITIYVVNYPLKYFAERIAGDHAKVIFPVPPDIDPAYWVPDTKTIAAYQQADLILLNGANYAKWVGKVSLPRSRMVDTSAKFKDRYITANDVVTHSHGAEGAHAHESLAFTTWLDFTLAVEQANTIAKALGRKKPDLQDTFQKNYRSLEKDLMALDKEVKNITAKNPSKPLIASHPVYDYLASRYGLNLKSVHWEPEEVPSDEQWIELHAILKDHPADWMIWEGKPADESVKKLKLAGINSLIFNPCGNTPGKGDFMNIMQNNFVNLRMAFESGVKP
jgi:zinc transport system substrate-binding protein